MIVKIKKQIETETEVEIQLPAYFSYEDSEWKIISEESYIQARPPKEGGTWCYLHPDSGFLAASNIKKAITEGTVSTAEKFYQAMDAVRKSVQKTIDEHFESLKETVNQDL
jgi:hypothetical protein